MSVVIILLVDFLVYCVHAPHAFPTSEVITEVIGVPSLVALTVRTFSVEYCAVTVLRELRGTETVQEVPLLAVQKEFHVEKTQVPACVLTDVGAVKTVVGIAIVETFA